MTCRRAVALGQHDQRATGGLELLDVGVHPAGGRGAERPAGVALRRLGRAGVVDRVVAQVLRHRLARVEQLLDLGVRDVASHDERAGEREPCLDRVSRQLGPDLVHRPVEVDPHDGGVGLRPPEVLVGGLGQEPRRVGLQRLEEHALGGDLAQRLPVGGAGDGDRDRAARRRGGGAARRGRRGRSTCRRTARRCRSRRVSSSTCCSSSTSRNPCAGAWIPRVGSVVEVLRARVLRGLERELGRRAADRRWPGGTAGRRRCRASAASRRGSAACAAGFRTALVSW